MKRILFSQLIFLCTLSFFSVNVRCVAADVERPKLVVGIVVDQMRWDYLYRYYDLYGNDGFKRLMSEGYNCENTMINYVPSVTAIGHTSVYTGSVPSIHGITGNYFFMDGKSVYCCEDTTVSTVGSKSDAGKMSPQKMLATTIGDEIKIATNFQSKVVGVALKDRAAILPAGHSADGAFWFDSKSNLFITSTYYMKKLPKWVAEYNKTIGEVTLEDVFYTPLGNKLTEEMAKAAITGEQLGQNGTMDMLTVSFSCTDLIGHKYGTHHEKTREIYVDLDSRLADFFSFLDETIGKGQYLVFLTADHGAANNILMMQEHGIPAEGFFSTMIQNELSSYLMEKFGVSQKLLSGISSYKVYLDHKAIVSQKLNLDEVKNTALEWLKEKPQFEYVVDFEHINDATVPSLIREKIINGYNRMRSGDIQLVLNPANYEVLGDEIDEGTTHGLWNPYDAHIPFIIMGWHVNSGTTQKPTYITDIAPTVCSLIHIQMPNGCIGNSVIQ
ncbi:MAG: alkaline phosphatase family protein [Prevotella sp.]|nr:alkaline phosphatase family protein [Prevotella sp.]